MPDNASTVLMDELIQHQVYLERFKQSQLRNVALLIGQLSSSVTAQLAKRGQDLPPSARSAQLQALLQDVGRLSDATASALQSQLTGQLQDLSAYEGGFTYTAFRAVLPVAVSVDQLSPATLWAATLDRPYEGRLMSEWFKDLSAVQAQRIQQSIRMGVVEGQTVSQLTTALTGTKAAGYADGVIQGVSRRAAEALAITSTNHVTTTARQQTIGANSEVVSSVLWRSTLDGKTTPICRARDGKTYPIDSGPRPPAHPRCRSTIVPVLKSWRELGLDLAEAPEGTRASLNGQVPASETYQTWLTRQPAAFQDEVLGPTRAALFRRGGLTLDKFVDEGTTKEYTLDQLKAKHPEAFKQAHV